MPIYEYECETCNCTCERININYDEIDVPICENCNIEMKKIISKTTFKLNGTCWASDGYSSEKEKDES